MNQKLHAPFETVPSSQPELDALLMAPGGGGGVRGASGGGGGIFGDGGVGGVGGASGGGGGVFGDGGVGEVQNDGDDVSRSTTIPSSAGDDDDLRPSDAGSNGCDGDGVSGGVSGGGGSGGDAGGETVDDVCQAWCADEEATSATQFSTNDGTDEASGGCGSESPAASLNVNNMSSIQNVSNNDNLYN